MQETAQQKIRKLFDSVVGDKCLVYAFDLSDRSVSQKLWSTGYYCKQFLNLDIDQFQVRPSASDTQLYGSGIFQTPTLDIFNFCDHLNLFLDGFLMNAMSTLDALAHELFLLYESPPMPANIYIDIDKAKQMLQDLHPNSRAGQFLDDQLSKTWFRDFELFRYSITHESLIRCNDITSHFNPVNCTYRLLRNINLPDDPQARPFTYQRKREADEYYRFIFRGIQQLVTATYKHVLQDIYINGNILPMCRLLKTSLGIGKTIKGE